MKVLYTDFEENLFNSSAGGNRTLSLLEALTANGITVVFFSGDQSSGKSKLDDQSLSNRSYKRLGGIARTWWNELFKGYPNKAKFLKTLSSERPDIIWLKNDVKLFRYLAELKGGLDAPIYLEQSEFLDIHKVQKTNRIRSVILDREQNFIEQVFLYQLNGLGLMTKTLFRHYSQHFGLKIPLLHLPMTVDFNRFENLVGSVIKEFKSPYIAFVGVMNNAKDGVDVLIEAFFKIANDFPEHTLYLVGPWQPDTPGHLKQIEDLGLTNRVFWMKTYPRDIIPSIIKKADLLVLPRPDSKQAQGGFPTKLGEYLATGNPVCATSVGEIPDYLTDNESVFFAQPGSFDSFADAMRRALSRPDFARLVGDNGRKVAEKEFNARIQAKKLVIFFEKLIESNSNDKK
ncbi:MAG TPA: hypothetical protein DCR48_09085 [Flavobacteriales bacterium]|nr:hypothetical protein [Flavobacteriales bacterium]